MKQAFNAVICVLNSKYIHSSLSPWCLLAGVEAFCKAEINATVIEGTINENIQAIADRIVNKTPKAVGFSCYIWNITMTKQLIGFVKARLPQTKIILGGPEVSYCAEKILREEPLVDFVISGEGEKPFARLLNAVYGQEALDDIPGVCYRTPEKIMVSPPNTPEEEPPSPYSDQYLSALNGRIAYLETSRGCPYSCAFCLSGRCGSVRYYDIERAKRELILLANSGTQTVKLVDRTFNANKKRANELYRFIIDNYGSLIPKDVCFHFEIAGDILDEETLDVLASAPAGLMQLEIGLQSFNEDTLRVINRKTDVNKLISNIKRLVSNENMHIHIDLIAGLPLEDWASFKKSFDIAYTLKPNMLQLGFLKPLHGAAMRESADKFPCTFSEYPPYEVIETPWISKEALLNLHQLEDALEHLANSGRFRRTLDYVFEQTKQSSFELFLKFGQYMAEKGKKTMPLDDYTALVYAYFSALDGIDKLLLRDIMVCDRLATNASGKLPQVLRVADKVLKKAIKALTADHGHKQEKGVKRGYALLYSKHGLVYCDYQNKNPITDEYPLFIHSLADLPHKT